MTFRGKNVKKNSGVQCIKNSSQSSKCLQNRPLAGYMLLCLRNLYTLPVTRQHNRMFLQTFTLLRAIFYEIYP